MELQRRVVRETPRLLVARTSLRHDTVDGAATEPGRAEPEEWRAGSSGRHHGAHAVARPGHPAGGDQVLGVEGTVAEEEVKGELLADRHEVGEVGVDMGHEELLAVEGISLGPLRRARWGNRG